MKYIEFYKQYNISFEPLPADMNEEKYALTKQFEKVQLLQQNSTYYTFGSGNSEKNTGETDKPDNIYGY